jgi:hypothetical protein
MDSFKERLGTFDVFEIEDGTEIYEDTEDIDEAAGAMKGLTGNIKKALLGKMGGENSHVGETGRIEHPTHLRKHLQQAADSGHVSVVHVDGKPVVGMSNAGPKGVYNVHSSGDERMGKTKEERRHGTGRMYGQTYVPPEYSRHTQTDVGKNTALGAIEDHLHKNFNAGSEDKMDLYKNHSVEVKSYLPDKIRMAKVDQRAKDRPNMQYNQKYGSSTDETRPYNAQRTTSKTPTGDVSGLRRRAAMTLAKKHLGDLGSPANKAKELHDELGRHLASGDSKSASRAADALQSHIRNSGLGSENSDIKSYASDLKDLSGVSGNWGKERARERLKGMRTKYGKNESLIPEVFRTLDVLYEGHSGDTEALTDIFNEYGIDNRLAQAMARKIVADGKHKELSLKDVEAVLQKNVHDPRKLKRISQAAYDAL